MKDITKITLTLGQLKRLVAESTLYPICEESEYLTQYKFTFLDNGSKRIKILKSTNSKDAVTAFFKYYPDAKLLI